MNYYFLALWYIAELCVRGKPTLILHYSLIYVTTSDVTITTS